MDEIVTPRLLLRRARMDDLEAMHEVLSNRQAARYWSTPPHEDMEVTREWLANMIASPPDESADFVIEHQGRVIGKAGFYRLPEIGYILHPDHWGQGLAYEALSAAIGRVFERFDLPALTADCDPRNLASLGLLQKLGFREVRREKDSWCIGGEWCDSIILELPRPKR